MSDLIERLNEPEICDGCKGSGQTATGYTGGESDGNAPELETCGTCGGPGSYVSDLHRDAAAELSRLTAEVERLRADAERYQWLRTRNDGNAFDSSGPFALIDTEDGDDYPSAEELDAAIDAAIKEAGNG